MRWNVVLARDEPAFLKYTEMDFNVNTLRPRQDGRHFTDDIFKCIFLNENVSIAIKISLKFVPKGPINNIPTLVQIIWTNGGQFSDAYMRHSASVS